MDTDGALPWHGQGLALSGEWRGTRTPLPGRVSGFWRSADRVSEAAPRAVRWTVSWMELGGRYCSGGFSQGAPHRRRAGRALRHAGADLRGRGGGQGPEALRPRHAGAHRHRVVAVPRHVDHVHSTRGRHRVRRLILHHPARIRDLVVIHLRVITHQDVVARTHRDLVIAIASAQGIVTSSAVDGVITTQPIYPIISTGTLQIVIACSSSNTIFDID